MIGYKLTHEFPGIFTLVWQAHVAISAGAHIIAQLIEALFSFGKKFAAEVFIEETFGRNITTRLILF